MNMRMDMRSVRITGLILGLWVGTAGAQAPAVAPSTPAPIRIGFVCPQSGGSADFGQSARLGAELAVKEVNEATGYMGRPFELVARDDKSTPDDGRKAAEDLVLREKVAFTVGFCNSGVALKSLEVFQQNQHLLMVPVATGSAITTRFPAKDSFIFRMAPSDTLQARFLVDEAVQRRGFKKVALFADKTAYGEGGLNDLTRFLTERGLQPVQVTRFDLGVTSLQAEVKAAQTAGAEAIIAYTVGPEMAQLAQARAATKFDGPLMGPWPLSLRTVWDRSNGAAEGAVMVQSIVPDLSNERRMSFIARLKRLAGDQPIHSLMAAAQTYDAVHLMVRATFQARGDTRGPALKTALESLQHTYAGVVTSHQQPFSPQDHEAFTANMIWLATWKHGSLQFLYPEDARRASVIRRKEAAN